jgi:very-short-patch-repair endonuclease
LQDVRLAGPLDALIDSVDPQRFDVDDRAARLGFDWLCWNGVVTRHRAVERLVRSAPDHVGAGRLLDLLGGQRFARCESDEERHLGELLARFDPPAEPQVPVSPRVRVDWYFRTLRLAVEYDGGVDHDGPSGRSGDARRDAILADLGIAVVRYRAADLRDDAALLSSLASRLTLRAHHLGLPAPTFR